MNQPQPTPSAVALWLKTVSREQLHEQGWIASNKRFHGIARAARPFVQAEFSEQEQEAAFDGFTLALWALAHFEDIDQLSELLAQPTGQAEVGELPITAPDADIV